eukprot:103416-Prorocentrum_lima.AAC.1
MLPFSEYHQRSRIRALSRLFLARHHDPSAKATFNPDTLLPYDYGKKRVGAPRLNWYQCTCRDYWNQLRVAIPGLPLQFDLHREAHRTLFLSHASKLSEYK